MLDGERRAGHIDELSVKGLTSHPSIFDEAIGKATPRDSHAQSLASQGGPREETFFDVAIDGLHRAADGPRPAFDLSAGRDGWVCVEVSPRLAEDSTRTIQAAARRHAPLDRPNLFLDTRETPAGPMAIEQCIFDGIRIHVTWRWSGEHHLAAPQAFLRGVERHTPARLDPNVASVAALFDSHWDVGVTQEVPPGFRNRMGIALAMRT